MTILIIVLTAIVSFFLLGSAAYDILVAASLNKLEAQVASTLQSSVDTSLTSNGYMQDAESNTWTKPGHIGSMQVVVSVAGSKATLEATAGDAHFSVVLEGDAHINAHLSGLVEQVRTAALQAGVELLPKPSPVSVANTLSKAVSGLLGRLQARFL